uniref:Uncharacterized protein n=1 Tax=Arundo donax TaxID=35708 RepID=A0A0A9ARJ8_ARUDO
MVDLDQVLNDIIIYAISTIIKPKKKTKKVSSLHSL